jgi:hypothetical protein
VTRTALTLLARAAFAAIDARPSYAEIYRPWCAQYFGRGSSTNCGFTSYEQCMMTATPGSGAWCVRNPWYLAYGEGRKADPIARRKRIRHE